MIYLPMNWLSAAAVIEPEEAATVKSGEHL
jgi:hypothetical protein